MHAFPTRPIHYLLCATLLLAAGCDVPAPESAASIVGTIVGGYDQPVAGATIMTVPATTSALSDSAGAFVLPGVPAGPYRLIASRDGARVEAAVRAVRRPTPVRIRLVAWRLDWSDEFEGNAVDDTRWHELRGSSGLPDQRQRFRPEMTSVADGMLRITTVPDTLEPGYYTGAQLESRTAFLFGRFEVRAKLPTGKGLWPGIWLWKDHSAPEIDIMEMVGNDSRTVWMTYHYADAQGARRFAQSSWFGPDRSLQFHTYSLEWYPGECVWSIDGVEAFRTPMVQRNEPLRLIIDTYVGGSWPGYPDATTRFPQYHDVEFARVYRAVE